MSVVFTIGHSTTSEEQFIGLLTRHRINAVGDVRSTPYSRHTPQFNREELASSLKDVGIAYVFMGHYLGARPKDPICYKNGRIDFGVLSHMAYFQEGLVRVKKGAVTHRIALMCSEKDPIMCHRMILITRNLVQPELEVAHILEDGSLESNDRAELRLVAFMKLSLTDLFMSREDVIAEAYRKQAERIAYQEDESAGISDS